MLIPVRYVFLDTTCMHTKVAINFKYSGSKHMMAFFRDRFSENYHERKPFTEHSILFKIAFWCADV